ncbi:MAG: sulfite exporter TauE/SafE family protein [Gammaproteobacteria bacterium]|nr:MAG: sulfite exporter TauE/SafE family protein [Gammaproteobacteria bacterium]
MIINFEIIIILLLLGSIVGFMAGLLGIGGGGIMVPTLTYLFLYQGINLDIVVHLALGTSMASIITGSFSSLMAHHKKNAVDWQVVKIITPGILIGAFLATFLVASLNTQILAIFFVFFMAFSSFKMFKSNKQKPSQTILSKLQFGLVGTMIGAISSMVSIGGGTMSVPFLMWQRLPITRAIGTSSTIGLPIAISATIGFIINGWFLTKMDDVTQAQLGFVFLPAVFLISIMSFFTAPAGVAVAHKLPTNILKKIFAILLMVLSIKMLFSIF